MIISTKEIKNNINKTASCSSHIETNGIASFLMAIFLVISFVGIIGKYLHKKI